MSLRRAGTSLFGAGLLVASVAAVLGGAEACRTTYCVGVETDPLAAAVTLGLLAVVAGVVVGGVGLLRSAT